VPKSDKVLLDLNNPIFQDDLFNLGKEEGGRVFAALRKLKRLNWSTTSFSATRPITAFSNTASCEGTADRLSTLQVNDGGAKVIFAPARERGPKRWCRRPGAEPTHELALAPVPPYRTGQ